MTGEELVKYLEQINCGQEEILIFFWVGFVAKASSNSHREILNNLKIKAPEKGTDNSEYEEQYCLASDGQLVNVCEYVTQIAKNAKNIVFF